MAKLAIWIAVAPLAPLVLFFWSGGVWPRLRRVCQKNQLMPRWELANQGRLLSNLRLGGAKSRDCVSLGLRSVPQRIGENHRAGGKGIRNYLCFAPRHLAYGHAFEART